MARRHIVPIFIPHLGCPHDCVFCNQRRISGTLEPATAQHVSETLMNALNLLPEDVPFDAAFYGGSFTAIPAQQQEELLTAALPFIQSRPGSRIRLSTRPDCVSPETIERLLRYDVSIVELGAQSMCDDVLRASGRGHRAADTVYASELLKKAGIQLILQMMTGLPHDNDQRALETGRQLIALQPDGVRIYPTVVIRDTALYDMWQAGTYTAHTVEDAVRVCAQLTPLFQNAGIPVIRLGLNPTEELSGGAAAAGAYHPALGELVYSRIFRDRAEAMLQGTPQGADIVLGVSPRRISVMVGQKRCNIEYLRDKFRARSIKVVPVPQDDDKIIIF